jgi:hypothetical protein
MRAAEAAEIKRQLWELLRLHQERSAFVRRWAEHERSLQNVALSRLFETLAARYEQHAALIREFLGEGNGGADLEREADGETGSKEPAKT